MDDGDNNSLIPNDDDDDDSSFSFQSLLFEDDWQLWDTYPTVDANATSPDPTAEMNHDTLTVESDSLPMTLSWEEEMVEQWFHSSSSEQSADTVEQWFHLSISGQSEAVEQWFQSSSSEQSETASQDDYVDVSSHEVIFTYEEQLMNLTEDVSKGLTAGVIDENVRRRTYENSSDETETCVICQHKLKNGEEAAKLECGHDFHFECIKTWLMVKNKCPLCNQKVI